LFDPAKDLFDEANGGLAKRCCPCRTTAEGHELDRKTEVERDDWTQVVSGGSEEVLG
jgi:hypothetical protein